MTNEFPNKFHGLMGRMAARNIGNELAVPYVTTKEHKLRCRFYSHFHPYTSELIKELIGGSIRGLQEADTKYQVNNDATLNILPFSMQVTVESVVSAYSSNEGKEISLKGTQVTLPDRSKVTFDGGKETTLPGLMVVTPEKGMQVDVNGAKETILFDAEIKLVNDTPVTLPSGSQVEIPGGTLLILKSCKPVPEFYEEFFRSDYAVSGWVQRPYPVKDLDFSSSGAYATYNWELFYHVPLTIAIHLSRNQRFEEAMQWFHYIFDPTDDSDGPTPERFWKVKPFQFTDVQLIEELLVNLSTGADSQLREEMIDSIGAWSEAPFRPHLVARYRHTAFMLKAVMAYEDNLLAFADSLFRQDTGESINEATQLYILAANILGPRPQEVPKKGSVRPQTYADLRLDLDNFGNALRKLEAEIPFDSAPLPNQAAEVDQASTLRHIGQTLYFCVPRNDKLISYWDTVADRLFKIRNSLNIQGIFRQLPLFEPPIDPALLAKAAAAGLDIGAVISGMNQPLPLVRFQFLVQKAAEICQEVKSLGRDLLSAIEKEDNEAVSILRARHESIMLDITEKVKYAQWQEAIKTREGLEESLGNAARRFTFYERLLGEKEGDIAAKLPELDALDEESLQKMKFKMDEPAVGDDDLRSIEIDLAQDREGIAGGKKISRNELHELNLLKEAQALQDSAVVYDLLGSQMALMPEVGAQAQPIGAGVAIKFGGLNLAKMVSMMATADRGAAGRLGYEAGKSAKIGTYDRREQEWAFQSNLAAGDVSQIFKQLRAAQIREAINEWEWRNHQKQLENSEEIAQFLKGEKVTVGDQKHKKISTQSLYAWMKRELNGLYGQYFQFAFDAAKKAERALQHELGDSKLSFLQFGYLSGKEGLLAGEKLYFDIKRMEMAYHDQNRREYELTKHVSLLQVDPMSLLQFRTTGSCTFRLTEELFDMDCPSHYFRRIKVVSLSIPCVTGPYTSVNCTLTLLKSTVRKSSLMRDGRYTREDAEDDRFSDYFGSIQSIVTSTGQSDSGLFEANLRDERYLPFEGSGAVSEWQLELPTGVRQFDYDTIPDVILHLRYTAREGGALLRTGAVSNLTTQIEAAQAAGSIRLFSIPHEFPAEWNKFKNAVPEVDGGKVELIIEIQERHFPYWSKSRLECVKQLKLFSKKGSEVAIKAPEGSVEVIIPKLDGEDEKNTFDNLLGNILIQQPHNEFSLKFSFLSDNSMEDLWLALTWGKGD